MSKYSMVMKMRPILYRFLSCPDVWQTEKHRLKRWKMQKNYTGMD